MKNIYSLIVLSLLMQLSIIFPAAYFLEQYTAEMMLESERSELQYITQATQFALPSFHPDTPKDVRLGSLSTAIKGLSRALETRTTLISSSGEVLADSNFETAELQTLENHNNRPEVVQARRKGNGYSVRHSDTLDHDVMYVTLQVDAKLVTIDNKVERESMIIRVSRPLERIAKAIQGFQLELLKTGTAITLLSIVMSVVGVLYLSRQIRKDSDSLEARVEYRTEEIVMLQMLSSLLNTCESLNEASIVMTELAPKLMPGTSGGISIYKASRNRLDLLSQWGDNFNSNPSLNPHNCWALKKGHQHNATTKGIFLPCEHWLGEAENTICIPLLAQGETVGVLHSNYHRNRIGPDATRILESIAEQTGLTLANIQLRQMLREQAQRDHMTGLYNRMYLMETMESSMQSLGEEAASSALLMIDVDNFKRFNDNFGHDAGDLVLKAIAKEIKNTIGPQGLPCRYGGEEFVVFLPGANRTEANACAEAIRLAISNLSLSLNNLPLGSVSASIGIALAPRHTTKPKVLISYADQALYKAKEAGRDQVVIFDPARLAP